MFQQLEREGKSVSLESRVIGVLSSANTYHRHPVDSLGRHFKLRNELAHYFSVQVVELGNEFFSRNQRHLLQNYHTRSDPQSDKKKQNQREEAKHKKT
jgi:hypothetical protein